MRVRALAALSRRDHSEIGLQPSQRRKQRPSPQVVAAVGRSGVSLAKRRDAVVHFARVIYERAALTSGAPNCGLVLCLNHARQGRWAICFPCRPTLVYKRSCSTGAESFRRLLSAHCSSRCLRRVPRLRIRVTRIRSRRSTQRRRSRQRTVPHPSRSSVRNRRRTYLRRSATTPPWIAATAVAVVTAIAQVAAMRWRQPPSPFSARRRASGSAIRTARDQLRWCVKGRPGLPSPSSERRPRHLTRTGRMTCGRD
jgi:hypothetical protein